MGIQSKVDSGKGEEEEGKGATRIKLYCPGRGPNFSAGLSRSSWQWLSQKLNLLPIEFRADSSRSFSSPLCQINADYTTLTLLLTDTLQWRCSLWKSIWLVCCASCPMLCYLMGIRGDGGTGFCSESLHWLRWFKCSHSSFEYHCVSMGDIQRELDKISLFVWLHTQRVAFF